MVHFFATLQRESFDMMKDVPKEKWFNAEDKSGKQQSCVTLI